MTAEIYIWVIVGSVVSGALHAIYASWLGDDSDSFPLISPAFLRKTTRMNWAGCIIYWILGLALAPLFTIPGIFVWLFTVGGSRR